MKHCGSHLFYHEPLWFSTLKVFKAHLAIFQRLRDSSQDMIFGDSIRLQSR